MPGGFADRASTAAPAPAAAQRSPHCRNCGAIAPGDYCAACGQETELAMPTLREFLRDAAGRLVAFDGRFWRSVLALALRPGFLTREYFAGRRRRYVRPSRLFLVLSLLVFAVIGVVQSPAFLADDILFVYRTDADAQRDTALEDTAEPDRMRGAAPGGSAGGAVVPPGAVADRTIFDIDDDLSVQLDLRGLRAKLPPELQRRYERFKGLSRADKLEHVYAGIVRYGPYALVLLLPTFALLQKLAYLGRGRRYPGRPQRYSEHLVYSAHLHAYGALAAIVWLLLPNACARAAIALWVFYYVLRARSVVYGGPAWAAALRALVVGTAYLLAAACAVVGLVVAAAMLR